MTEIILSVLVGLGGGLIVGLLIGHIKAIRAATALDHFREQLDIAIQTQEQHRAETEQWRTQAHNSERDLEGLRTRLETERRAADQRLQDLLRAQNEMKNAFGALAGDVLKQSEERFLSLAEQKFKNLQEGAKSDLTQRQEAIGALVNPMREGLEKMDQHLRTLETVRASAYAELRKELHNVTEHNTALRRETQTLAQALRAPKSRGSWGEMQLRRVVELAGMQQYVDFMTQVSANISDGDHQQRQQPDMVINLPGNRCIIVDSKVPLDAFMKAAEIADPIEREPYYTQHAHQFKGHVQALAKKSYWQQFENTPDFVVMFVPGEHYFAVAVDHQADLIDRSLDQGVIIASPTTLLALLRAVHFGWRQESLAENAHKIGETGRELHDRLGVFIGHLGNTGKSLNNAITHYNKTISSLETRVMVSLRKMQDLHLVETGKSPDTPDLIEQTARPMLIADSTEPA